MAFEPFDVVTLPFPFSDRQRAIVRPAIILTDHAAFGAHSGIALVAMVTSAKHSAWPYDVPITDLASAGLAMPCLVRQKLNSVAFELMDRKIGTIADVDRPPIRRALRQLLDNIL